jgi:RhoGAP domain/Variant SH3 domain/N-terminal or F0 domain of Talin-head FERM
MKTTNEKVIVRVDFPSERMSKKIQVASASLVGDVKKTVYEKMRPSSDNVNDFALYCPPGGGNNAPGEWMMDDDPVGYYMVEQRGVIEFRMRPRELIVRFEPPASTGSQGAAGGAAMLTAATKQAEVDFTVPSSNIALKFVGLLDLPRPSVDEHYSLYTDDSPPVLIDAQSSLATAGIRFGGTVILRLGAKPGAAKSKEGTRKGLKSFMGGKVRLGRSNKGGSGNSSDFGSQGSAVFGTPLKNVAVNDSVKLVDDAIAYIESKALDVEGIFRLSGSATEIQALKKKYNAGEQVDLNAVLDPHVVCGLLKLWLREMPEPLFTWVNYEPLLAVQMISDPDTKLRYLRALIDGLPPVNRKLIQQLLFFTQKVIAHEGVNKMPIHNVATVFGPNLLKSIHEGATPIVEDTGKVLGVTSALILNADAIFDSSPCPFSGVAKSLYDFQTDKDYELSLNAGDIVFIVCEDDGGWWRGEIAHTGQAGLFPSNYVTIGQHLPGGEKPAPAAEPVAEPAFAAADAGGGDSPTPKRATPKEAMSKADFNSKLDNLRQLYDAERNGRLELEELAAALEDEVGQLREMIRQVSDSNDELRAFAGL